MRLISLIRLHLKRLQVINVDTFDRNFQFNVEHVSLAKKADCVMVAPASADIIGKMANGIADDM